MDTTPYPYAEGSVDLVEVPNPCHFYHGIKISQPLSRYEIRLPGIVYHFDTLEEACEFVETQLVSPQ